MNVDGLVMAGGESKRLGIPKYKIRWHGSPHWNYLANLISQYCDRVFISTQHKSKKDFPNYKVLTDRFNDLGPMAGLITFFDTEKEKACLAVACDLPMINEEVLGRIIQERDPAKIATCAFSEKKGLPEPLLAIWEHHSRNILTEYKNKRNYSLQRILENHPVKRVPVKDQYLLNVNTREDFFLAKSQLPYLPINCGFHDYFEEAITKGKKCNIEFFDNGKIYSESAFIKGLETHNAQEYLILDSGRRLRLDQVMVLNNIKQPII